jgi:hypothetical protein
VEVNAMSDLNYKELQSFMGQQEVTPKVLFQPTTIICSEVMTNFLTKKSYGSYIRGGKQFWRNYHREIKRKDAKSFLEVQYLSFSIEYKLLFKEENI